MSQPNFRPNVDRRHSTTSNDELRRELLASDAERYRLESELRALRDGHAEETPPVRPPLRTRQRPLITGLCTVVLFGLAASGAMWEMRPSMANAGDRVLRVETRAVTPRIIIETSGATRASQTADAQRSAELQTTTLRAEPTSPPHVRRTRRGPVLQASAVRRVNAHTRARKAPRPLSPGEFGRKAL
jgi:hypothetical protein